MRKRTNTAEENPQKTMNVVGHLTELRKRVVVVVVVFLAAVVLSYFAAETVISHFLDLGGDFHFIYINPSELVMSYVRVSLICGLVITIPVILFELWQFLVPALSAKEKKMGLLGFLGGVVFFAAGAAFAYSLMIPFMIRFFIAFDTLAAVSASISVENYIGFILSTITVFGLIFEMPLLALILSSLGILKSVYLKRFRKYAVLIVFLVAAIITPPDVVSQILVACPMLLLYEFSRGICVTVEKRKARRIADDTE